MNADDDEAVIQPTERTRDHSMFGKFRLPGDLEPIEVTFLLLAFVSIVGAAIITVVKLIEVTNNGSCKQDCTFAILLLVNLVFVLYYTIHGIFWERPFELLASIIATVIVMLYCIVHFAVSVEGSTYSRASETYKLQLGRLIAISVLGPIDIILGCIIGAGFYRSRNLIFRTVGGNAVLQSMCQTMFMFTAFLKFDFQLVISLLILVINGPHLSLGEKIVLGLGVPLSLGWVILGFMMVHLESMRVNALFWLFSVAEPSYIIFLFVRASNNPEELLNICIIGGGVVALCVRGLLLLLSYFVTKNFGKGLKEKVFGDQQENIATPTNSQPTYQATENDN